MLEPKEEELLEKTYDMEQENNKLLRSIHSDMIFTRIFRTAYFLIILAIMFGAYYYIQPYIGSTWDLYQKATSIMSSFGK